MADLALLPMCRLTFTHLLYIQYVSGSPIFFSVMMGSHGKPTSQRDLARFAGADGALPLTARAAVIIIAPAGTIWKGYFHLLKGLWVGFLLALI